MKIKYCIISGKPVFVLVMALWFVFCHSLYAEDIQKVPVSEFFARKMQGWEPKKFVGETVYSISFLENEPVLKAVSKNAASGLIKKIRVDLDKTPFLNWKWRIENKLSGDFDETLKPGDDYAARIYVVVSGGFAVWNTKAMNYVWAKHSSKGDIWPNAFAEKNAVMIALRSSEAQSSVWYVEKRNIQKDFNLAFSEQVRFIDAVVLMSDTDNTQNSVTAFYGDIYFSSD
ncbi:MAG: DUF3047 domain-containing protein [Proteobacteria bacterium]|nr:DUF3047 domain-containing protein [Pseudomonadota bacterium]MBU1386661.1 DUF3047 domain-containing protein [Pseudomonadota bacterium]MBU1543272.1 DUF3047 domain-containing protein [Pseudomonadota bacterium]MBU2483103.1 DUF3047 domain-containing protein [Pseudomonadota bacterium]